MAKPDWVGVTLPEESSGNKQIAVICQVNRSMSPRSGVITVTTTNGGKTAEIQVSQKAHTITYSYNIQTINNCSAAHTNVLYLNWEWDNGEKHGIPNHLGGLLQNGESQTISADDAVIEASVGNIIGLILTRTPDTGTVACDIDLRVNDYTVRFSDKKSGDSMTLNSQIPITDTLNITGTITYKDL